MPTEIPISASNCRSCATRKACLLGRLGDAERALLEPQIRQRIFRRGDALVEEGTIAGFVRVLKLGTAFAYRRGLDGRSRPIGVISRGDAFGIFGMFDNPNPASGVALTTVRVCEIPVVALRDMSACGSPLLVQVIRAVTGNFAAMAAWSEAMRLSGVTNQLAYVVVLMADASKSSVVEIPTQSALAELLGTRRESIARALRTLDVEGSISRLERKRCEVYRSRLLARLAQAGNEERS
ncbi:Crp/Fnr family transcriptional regulator [Variovorax sp. M-6]|uniref:Crp/Fnr family transcriptional regulator n=1 Tax=Variovorax sp. M-6 TaxID=3233041 RepID=UPI003F9718EE